MGIRITDAHKPGYERVAIEDVGRTTPPGAQGTTGSPVLNQAQAAVLGMPSSSVPVAPVISGHPASVSVTEPAAAAFTVVAQGEGLSYQWKRNGVAISGATSPTYSLPTTSNAADDGALFTCTVSNAGGSVTSNAATLTVASSVGLTTARFWRFEFPDTTYDILYELQLIDAQGVNHAAASRGATITADSQYSVGNAPSYALDGIEDDSHKWASAITAAMIHWVEVDLGASGSRDIVSVRLVPRNYEDAYMQWTRRSVVIKTGSAPNPTGIVGTFTAGIHYPSYTTAPVTLNLKSVPTAQIPDLTSNTGPNGVLSASNEYNASYAAWKARDTDAALTTKWNNLSGSTGWLQYAFSDGQHAVTSYQLRCGNPTAQDPRSWKLQGSNDGTTWTDLDTRSRGAWLSGEVATYTLATPASYSQYRLNVLTNGGAANVGVYDWQLFGFTDRIGVMTLAGGNTNANGTMSVSSIYGNNPAYGGWTSANRVNDTSGWANGGGFPAWIQFSFTVRKLIAQYRITVTTLDLVNAPKTWTLQGSNDGTNWTTVDTRSNITWASAMTKTFQLAEPVTYKHYRLHITESANATYVVIAEWYLDG